MRLLAALLCACVLAASSAAAEVTVVVDKAAQSMTVAINGAPTYRWPVSTGLGGYNTPEGEFRAERLARVYYSQRYDDAPMPNSVFFHKGYAIHGTYHEDKLGRPASHGCIRLSRHNAITLFNLVQAHGMRATRIVIHGGDARVPMASNRREIERTRYVAPPAYENYKMENRRLMRERRERDYRRDDRRNSNRRELARELRRLEARQAEIRREMDAWDRPRARKRYSDADGFRW